MSQPAGAALPVLVVAGSDSSGGAGVDADRHALEAAEVPGQFLVTAWTRQDEDGLRELGAVESSVWLDEAAAVIEGGVGAVKFGLLPGPAAVAAAGQLAATLDAKLPVVLDPVLGTSSGTRFHDERGVRCLLQELLPLGLVWTPNLPELAELTGVPAAGLAADPGAREEAGHVLLHEGARAVVIKGGHGEEDPICDLLVRPGTPALALERPRIPGASIRGSGCRFASFLAAKLARGADLPDAARQAGEFVASCLKNSPK